MTDKIAHSAGADSQFQMASTLIDFRKESDGQDEAQAPLGTAEPSSALLSQDRLADDLQRKEGGPQINLPDRLQVPGSQKEAYIESMTRKIRASLMTTTVSIFETGRLLAEAERKLDREDFKRIWAANGFRSLSNVQNHIRIVNAPNLQMPEFQPYLPPIAGTLIDLAAEQWTPEELRACINAGVLTQATTRAHLKKWVDQRRPTTQQPEIESEVPTQRYEAAYVIYFHRCVSRAQRASFKAMISDWHPNHGSGGSQNGNSPMLVVRKVDSKDVKYDLYDRFSDQHGNIVHEDGEWKSPTRIRQHQETATPEPWDRSLGVRPGDRV